jgi:uncharacterized repeat protein (TIGR01451 family)
LQDDADVSGTTTPGDTLRYTVVISNSGSGDASDVALDDTPDANTALVTGSVTTTQGTVASGNSGGDSSVSVDVGALAAGGGSVTIEFDVTINGPLPIGVTELSNQGTVSGSNFANLVTDDPDTPAADDPTVDRVVIAGGGTIPPGSLPATKTSALQADADGSGTITPGDTLRYTVVLTNSSSDDASDVTLDDTPDANTALVVGSVTTTQGAVVSGNGGGDTSVSVAVGTLAAGGGSVTIEFDVTIDGPLPTGVTEVSNQGTVSGSNFANLVTDDPSTPATDDPTVDAVENEMLPVPTLGFWGTVLLAVLLLAVATRVLKQRQIAAGP